MQQMAKTCGTNTKCWPCGDFFGFLVSIIKSPRIFSKFCVNYLGDTWVNVNIFVHQSSRFVARSRVNNSCNKWPNTCWTLIVTVDINFMFERTQMVSLAGYGLCTNPKTIFWPSGFLGGIF